jgi:hypothetical protein
MVFRAAQVADFLSSELDLWAPEPLPRRSAEEYPRPYEQEGESCSHYLLIVALGLHFLVVKCYSCHQLSAPSSPHQDPRG